MALRRLILSEYLSLLLSDRFGARALATRQNAALVRTMQHAAAHVPHYRDLGIGADVLHKPGDLQRFPVLTKRDLRAAGERLIADGYKSSELRWSRTSGSTGEPTVTYFDDRAWALCRYAVKIRRLRAMAPLIGRRVLLVSDREDDETAGSMRKLPFSLPGYRERVVSLYDDMRQHITVLDEFRPDVIQAYPSYLIELARVYTREGRSPPKVPWLCVSSEFVREQARRTVENAFSGKLFDVYGSTEFKEVAWQCRYGTYHVNIETVYVEIIDDHVGDGSGQIVLTTTCNKAMPLLRYATADRGSLRQVDCECGRAGPELRLAAGRENEMILLPSGRRISTYLLDVDGIERLHGLRQFQFVHSAPNQLRLEYVVDRPIDARQLQWLEGKIVAALGEPMQFEMRRVDAIARAPRSKLSIYRRDWEAPVGPADDPCSR
jgi:phenylacetate-CoA ligase